MAELITVARPYAEAVYRLAKQQNTFDGWSKMLELAVSVESDARLQPLIGNPLLPRAQMEHLFLSVCGTRLSAEGKNLISLLVENGRLALLSHIAAAYEDLRAAEQGVTEARIATAFPFTDGQLKDLLETLQARFKRKIEPSVVVDPDLIGGVKVEVGDEVFDASVRGRLDTMASSLKR